MITYLSLHYLRKVEKSGFLASAQMEVGEPREQELYVG